jgi:hypothetical protein
MPERSLSNTRIFSIRHITDFLRLGTLGSTSAIRLGGILDIKITYKKKAQKNEENALKVYMKDLFTAGE